MQNNWTEKFESLKVGESFPAERRNLISLNSTKQRMKIKYPERVFSVIQGGNLADGKATVTRLKNLIIHS